MSAYIATILVLIPLCSVFCHGYQYGDSHHSRRGFQAHVSPYPPSSFTDVEFDYDLEPVVASRPPTLYARKSLLNTILAALESVEASRDEATQGMDLYSGSAHKRATFWTPLRGPLPVEASFDQDGGASGGDGIMTRNKAKGAMRYGRK